MTQLARFELDRVHCGDALTLLRELPDESVNCVVTSPAYYSLRDYETATWEGGDPDCDHAVRRETTRAKMRDSSSISGSKETVGLAQVGYRNICRRCGARRVDTQMGLEATPGDYVAALVEVFREVRRVLRKDGTVWVVIGDSYSNDDKWGGSTGGKHATALHGDTGIGRARRQTGLKAKDRMMIPARVALALQADGWWLRDECVWHKENAMPSSVQDRTTSSHEMIYLLTKAAHYWYDAEAIKEPLGYPLAADGTRVFGGRHKHGANVQHGERTTGGVYSSLPSGRNKRSVWTVNTAPQQGEHYAAFPPDLIEPCILAGCPDKTCAKCGAPWERAFERGDVIDPTAKGSRFDQGKTGVNGNGRVQQGERLIKRATGWQPTCDCGGDVVPGIVLDPFAGTGTTLLVAAQHHRYGLGFDLNPKYTAMANRRLTVSTTRADRKRQEQARMQPLETLLLTQLSMPDAEGAK